MEIGGRPIVWHVIRLYAAQGFDRFVLAAGYRGELIERFAEREPWPSGVEVEVLDTGAETETGGRVAAAARHLAGEQRLCVTYSDGVADVDLDELLAFHAAHGGPATVTVVRPASAVRRRRLDAEDRVVAFDEKPRSEHWINGGFFCFERRFLDRLARGQRARARAARPAGVGRRAAGLPPPRLLALHGHAQGRHLPERDVGFGRGPLAPVGRATARRRRGAGDGAPAGDGARGASSPPLVAS